MELTITVFVESESATIQAADMDTVGHPNCTRTNATQWGNSVGKGDTIIPQGHLILLDAATRAAEKLGCQIEVIDISDYSFWQKRKLKGVIPRIEIGDKIITGLPTSDEIVSYVIQSPLEYETSLVEEIDSPTNPHFSPSTSIISDRKIHARPQTEE